MKNDPYEKLKRTIVKRMLYPVIKEMMKDGLTIKQSIDLLKIYIENAKKESN
jgi:hypothetical protein